MQDIKTLIYDGLADAMNKPDPDAAKKERFVQENYEPLITKSIFPRPFMQNNIMCKCRLECVQQKTFRLDLQQLNRVNDNMFYSSQLLPSLLMVLPDFAPVVSCSCQGHITMTGGNSLEEIQYCLNYYCQKLLYYLDILYPDLKFTVNNFQICNRLLTSRLDENVDLFTCAENIKKLSASKPELAGIKVKYAPIQINLMYINPPKEIFGSSIRLSVGAEGGVNVFGVSTDAEVVYMSKMLSVLLAADLHPKFNLAADQRRRKKKADKKHETLLLEREKLINKWKNLTKNKKQKTSSKQ